MKRALRGCASSKRHFFGAAAGEVGAGGRSELTLTATTSHRPAEDRRKTTSCFAVSALAPLIFIPTALVIPC